ncbi:SigE family RNA polymerase sigma factor [Catenulispora pinisilvae]|uniref:SigE family RNA polymerase sigma factor n=1 Tax=Catenulispora pinisilvae TaxID=2705253 RepID=UPI0018911DEC|nr:SigE family RNA polymerase sigma factor [Catenulispora pinisilvae]
MRSGTDDFREFVSARQGALRRTAYLLCGDWHQAQDLTQQTLAKLFVAWSRVRAVEAVDSYARQVLVRTYIDESRKRRNHEVAIAEVPDSGVEEPEIETRLALMAALKQLSPRQRAVVALRFWDDLSVEATAEALGMKANTVKSDTARALAKLKGLLDSSVHQAV